MATNLTTSSDWQRIRAIELHDVFARIERVCRHEGLSLAEAVRTASAELANKSIRCRNGSVKVIKASVTTLLTHYYNWKNSGRKPAALLHDYKPGRARIPGKLIAELQRRSTIPGVPNISVAIKALRDDWKAGESIPGLGTWQEWWLGKHPQLEMPPHAPDFPYSERTLYRAKPSKRERALGNKGIAAFKALSPFVSLNYSNLRKCELYTLDDVRLDIVCIDEFSGKAIEVVIYVMMEVASRSIVAYILKPAARIEQKDVDELLAYGLQAYGIGDGYTTHIKFERGSVACSKAAQQTLEAASEGAIRIHRTSVNAGIRWIGAPKDKASGHAAGKAVIESFNRKLHLMLMRLPGQRGNKFENQPANLGYEGPDKITPGSLADDCQKLAHFQIVANSDRTAPRLRLILSMLYLRQLDLAVREAIKVYNNEPGHDFQGHGSFIKREIAPGVWSESSDLASNPDLSLNRLTPSPVAFDAQQSLAASSPAPAGDGAVSSSSKKTYSLKSGPPTKATTGEYWRLWKKLHSIKQIDRHALTHRTLGCHPKVNEMTPDQLAKMISVFSAILRGRRSAPDTK